MCLAACAALCGVAQSQEPGGGPPGVTLDVDPSVARKLAAVQDYATDKQWAQAVSLIRDVSTRHGGSLISPEPGWYVSIEKYCQLLMCSLPPEGLAVYRRQIDPLAEQWLDSARTRHDTAALNRILREAFASSSGDDALLLAGERAWEQGQPAVARALWTQLLPLPAQPQPGTATASLRYPDSGLPREQILARLILCSLAAGDTPRARQELREFTTRFPEATGRLAGREGTLATLLQELLREDQHWSTNPPAPSAATFALSASRNGKATDTIDPGSVRWSVPLPGPRLSRAARRGELPGRGPLSWHPVVWDSLVLVNDGARVFGWNLYTGRPAWSEGIPAPHPVDDAVIFHTSATDAELYPTGIVAGHPHYTLTIDQGRLFARMGTPLLSGLNDPIRTFRSELVCLDLQDGQGRLLWRLDAKDLPGQEGVNGFAGTPVAAGGRLYVAWRSSQPQTELHVACLTAADGSLIWSRRVCALAAETARGRKVAGHQLLTVAAGRVYCGTDSGAIAALSAESGALQWVRTYPRNSAAGGREHSRRMAGGLTPCLYANERVYAAPADSDSLLCLDATTGHIHWEQSLRGGVAHLLGTIDGRLVVAGHRLWAIDCQTGQVAWHAGFDDRDAGTYGRAAIAGNLVYWPLRDELLLVNASSGRIQRRMALAAMHGHQGGNLTIADGHLLIAGPQQLTAFSEYGQLRQRIRDAISQAPGNARNWLRLGLLEEARGNNRQAADAFQQAVEKSDSGTSWQGRPTTATALCRQSKNLLALADELQQLGDYSSAAAQARTAASLASTPALSARGWLLAGQLELAAHRPLEAMAACREVLLLREAQRRSISASGTGCSTCPERQPQVLPLGEAARQARVRIAAVRRNLSSAQLTRHERHVAEQIRLTLQHETPLPALVRLARTTPGEPAIHQAVRNRALHHRQPAERQRAAMLARELALPVAAEIPLASGNRPENNNDGDPAAVAPATRSIPLVEEAWRLPLPPEFSTFLPDCSPGSPRTGLLIDNSRELQWVSLTDGAPTFRLPADLRPRWSCEVHGHLLIQTQSDELVAFHTGDGHILWRVSPEPAAAPRFLTSTPDSPRQIFHPAGTALLVSVARNRIVGRSLVDGVPLWHMQTATRHLLPPQHNNSTGTLLTSDRGPHTWLSHITAEGPSPILLAEPPDAVAAFAVNLEPTAVVLSSTGVLTAFRRAGRTTARVLWRTAIVTSGSSAAPRIRITGAYLLLAIDARRLHCFAMEDGEHCWSCRMAPRGENSPAIRVDQQHSRVLLGEGTSIACRNLADGAELWRRRTTGSCHLVLFSRNLLLAIPAATGEHDVVHLDLLAADSGEPVQRKPLSGFQGSIACHQLGKAATTPGQAKNELAGGLLIARNGISRIRLTTARAIQVGAQQR